MRVFCLVGLFGCAGAAPVVEEPAAPPPAPAPTPEEDFASGRASVEGGDLAGLALVERACASLPEACAFELETRLTVAAVPWDATRMGALRGETPLSELEARRMELCEGDCRTLLAELVGAETERIAERALTQASILCGDDPSQCTRLCDAPIRSALVARCETPHGLYRGCRALARLSEGVCDTDASCARRYHAFACVRSASCDGFELVRDDAPEGECSPPPPWVRARLARSVEEFGPIAEDLEDADVDRFLRTRVPGLPALLSDGSFALPSQGDLPSGFRVYVLRGRRVETIEAPGDADANAARAHVARVIALLAGSKPLEQLPAIDAPTSRPIEGLHFHVDSVELRVGDRRVWRGRGLRGATCATFGAAAHDPESGRFIVSLWAEGMSAGDGECPRIDPRHQTGRITP